MIMKEHYDFSCWVIKYDRVSIHGKVYQKDSLKNSCATTIPLLWNHDHYDPGAFLGYAVLENSDDGIYAYCTLTNPALTESVKELIQDRGSVSISPYITQVKMDKKYITHGIIKEVSLVLARVDPDEPYYPIMKHDVE